MLTLAAQYLQWHYSRSLYEYWGLVRNFLWFFYNFFSFPSLVKTLFVPFHRLTDTSQKRHALDFQVMAEHIVISTLMRLVGFLMRGTLILLGIVALVATALFGGVFFLVWLFAPLLVVFLIASGMLLLIVS